MPLATHAPFDDLEFKDPYYYGLVAMTWLSALLLVLALWAMSPWFP